MTFFSHRKIDNLLEIEKQLPLFLRELLSKYADDIILLAKSIRAAERLFGTSTEYLEKKLKLKVNTEKSRAISVYSIRNAMGKSGGKRGLGIPTISDRIVQMTAKLYLEPKIEPIFHKDSYGYRPRKERFF